MLKSDQYINKTDRLRNCHFRKTTYGNFTANTAAAAAKTGKITKT